MVGHAIILVRVAGYTVIREVNGYELEVNYVIIGYSIGYKRINTDLLGNKKHSWGIDTSTSRWFKASD